MEGIQMSLPEADARRAAAHLVLSLSIMHDYTDCISIEPMDRQDTKLELDRVGLCEYRNMWIGK